MPISDQRPAMDGTDDISGLVNEADLDRVLKTVPQGALALAGTALGLLILAWLAVYFLVFLQRGPIG